MTDFDKLLGDNDKTETIPNASAPTEKAKKTVKKAAKPTPEVEDYLNPVPNAPEINGLLPGQKGYNYNAAVKSLQTEIADLTKQLEGLRAASRDVQVMRNSRVKPLSATDGNAALRRQNQRIAAEAQEKQAKIAAVLKEMGLA
ncbi:MAG TPA: hypothetical protein EYF98_13715 [Planctomycetes bacterium]|nr:hypothetical protein [Planctomycetota bacterium]